MKRKQFTFYRSFYEGMMCLPKSSRLEFIQAVIEFALDGVEPEHMSKKQAGQFVLIRPVLEAAAKKAERGAKGGSISKRKIISKGENKIELELESELKLELESKTDTEIDRKQDASAGEGVRAFEDFWNLYPKKIGRPQAFEEWKRLDRDPGQVMEALRAWVASDQWKTDNGRYVPRADKWLREEHFLEIPNNGAPPAFTMGQAELEAIRLLMADEEGA